MNCVIGRSSSDTEPSLRGGSQWNGPTEYSPAKTVLISWNTYRRGFVLKKHLL